MKSVFQLIGCVSLFLVIGMRAIGEEIIKGEVFEVREPAFGYPGFGVVGSGSFLLRFGVGHWKKLYVNDLYAGSSAEEAGLEAGDQIVSIDGVSPSDWSRKELHTCLTSQAGKKLAITIKRGPDDKAVSCTFKIPRYTAREFEAMRGKMACNYWDIIIRNICTTKWQISNNFLEENKSLLIVRFGSPNPKLPGFRLEKNNNGEVILKEEVTDAKVGLKPLSKGDSILLESDGSYRIEYSSLRPENDPSAPDAPHNANKGELNHNESPATKE